MEDVRPTSWGDGQGFAIGDMAELGYVSEVMIVEWLAETTDIAVEF
jgi:hypothetical protein